MDDNYINPDYINDIISGLSLEQLNQFNESISKRMTVLKIQNRQCVNCCYKGNCINPEIDYWLGDCLEYKED